ncbi:uncharacterized protein [Branchiostoma lanceolatum]|uniref:uncharacterized protein n=1 Tax=Branchiostoma lanceolatum TaxID=7740 RepID=UPI00345629D3
MGTCASVNANQVQPLPEAPVVRPDTAVFTRPSPSQTTTVTTKTLELRDATPLNLKQVFKLDFYPKEITDKTTHVTKIHQGPPSQPFWNLEVNAEYEVGGGEAEEDLYMEMIQRPSMKSGDVQRALICSEAVYLSDLPDTDAIQQFFDHERNLHDFERVSVSRYGSVGYLLAETRDKEEVFVAFKGTTDFKDVMSDLNIWQEGAGQSRGSHNSGVGGKYHAGFMHLAFRVPADRIVEEYSNSRIVVCGHSLGGAVAHIVALNMMVYLRTKGQPVDNVTSIAFGAPYFGNDGAQQFAEEHNLSPRMLTIVDEKDPVPYILRLAETVQCAGQTVLKKVEDFTAKATPAVVGILGILTASGVLGVCTFAKGVASVTFSGIPAAIDKCRRMLKLWGLTARELDSLYVPLGWYLCISCSASKAGGGALWRRSLLTHPGSIQYTAPDIRAWKEEDFQCHRVSNYRTIFFEIAKKTTYRDDDETIPSSDVIIVDSIFPASIKSLRVLTKEGDSRMTKTCQVVIDGDNLDFVERDKPILDLPVTTGGKFVVVYISRQRVALQCEIKSDGLSEEATVVVRTHFEQVTVSVDIEEVPELPYKEGLISQVMKDVVEKAAGEPPAKEEAAGPSFGSLLSDAKTLMVNKAKGLFGY